jgi:hypothetical protein
MAKKKNNNNNVNCSFGHKFSFPLFQIQFFGSKSGVAAGLFIKMA